MTAQETAEKIANAALLIPGEARGMFCDLVAAEIRSAQVEAYELGYKVGHSPSVATKKAYREGRSSMREEIAKQIEKNHTNGECGLSCWALAKHIRAIALEPK